MVKYKNNSNLEGLENVLYFCPHCGKEFSMEVREKRTIFCRECGYEQVSDEYGFLHNTKGVGEEIPLVSDWSRKIYETLRERVKNGTEGSLESPVVIRMIDRKKHKFADAGEGVLSLSQDAICLKGCVNGEPIDLKLSGTEYPTLPFSPGKRFEIQQGKEIYRCVLEDGRLAMKFINMVKIFYEMSRGE